MMSLGGYVEFYLVDSPTTKCLLESALRVDTAPDRSTMHGLYRYSPALINPDLVGQLSTST